MRYWRILNDLYTGETAPAEAVEVTEAEYNAIMNGRTVTHVEPTEDDDPATEADYLAALAEMGVTV